MDEDRGGAIPPPATDYGLAVRFRDARIKILKGMRISTKLSELLHQAVAKQEPVGAIPT